MMLDASAQEAACHAQCWTQEAWRAEYNVLTWRELESRLNEHKECSSAQSKDPAHVSGSTGVRLNMGKTNMAMHNAMCPPSRNCLPYTPWPGHCFYNAHLHPDKGHFLS